LVGTVWAACLLALPAVALIALRVIDYNVGLQKPPGHVVAPFLPGGLWARLASPDSSGGSTAPPPDVSSCEPLEPTPVVLLRFA